MNKIFSVITVTYNAENWLENTIQSILSQSYKAVELLIIDGGSTDGTLDIIKKYEQHLAYWISEADQGLYDAMNKGINAAKGEYLWFINAGDRIYAENTVFQLVEILKDQSPDILYGETQIIDEQGNYLGNRRLRTPEQLSVKSFRMGMLVCHQSFIVKRDIAPLYDLQYRYSADFDWCIRCMKKACDIRNTHLTLSCFLTGGLSESKRKKALHERYHIMCENYGKFTVSLLHLWFAIRFYAAKFTGKNLE